MRLSVKFAIYFLIIASEIDNLLVVQSRPVDFKLRKKRQVVQPKWLSGLDRRIVDSKVRVTEQNLKEAAALRAAIQKAINSGTFAVNVDQPNAPIPTIERSKTANKKPFFPKFEMPDFEMPEFDVSQFNFSDFGLPEFDLAEFDPTEFFTEKQRATFVGTMSKLWQQFWDTSQKVLSTISMQNN